MLEQQIEFLAKYASLAEQILTEEYGLGNFQPADIEKVAAYMIEEDQERANAFDVVENITKQAKYIAHGFFQELSDQIGQEKAAELVNSYIQKLGKAKVVKNIVNKPVLEAQKNLDKAVAKRVGAKSSDTPAEKVVKTKPKKSSKPKQTSTPVPDETKGSRAGEFVEKHKDLLTGIGAGGAGGLGLGYALG